MQGVKRHQHLLKLSLLSPKHMLGSSCGAKEEHSGSAPCWPCGCSLGGSCPHFPSMFRVNEKPRQVAHHARNLGGNAGSQKAKLNRACGGNVFVVPSWYLCSKQSYFLSLAGFAVSITCHPGTCLTRAGFKMSAI